MKNLFRFHKKSRSLTYFVMSSKRWLHSENSPLDRISRVKRTHKRMLVQILVQDDNDRVLLARQKGGMYDAKWLGLFGEWTLDESLHESCARIAVEQANVSFHSLERRAEFIFTAVQDDEPCKEHEFVARLCDGGVEVRGDSIEELRWFAQNELPFENMPADDELWYDLVLEGNFLKGNFHMDDINSRVISHSIEVVDKL